MNNWAIDSRDGSEVRELCLPSARQCKVGAESADRLKADDVFQVGGDVTFTVDRVVLSQEADTTTHVKTRLQFSDMKIHKPADPALARAAIDLRTPEAQEEFMDELRRTHLGAS